MVGGLVARPGMALLPCHQWSGWQHPLPASSGNTSRHRLSRSGDRQLNRAVDVVVRTRMNYDPVTCEYVERRRAEGLSKREIRRCLKRYVCRSLFREPRTRMA